MHDKDEFDPGKENYTWLDQNVSKRRDTVRGEKSGEKWVFLFGGLICGVAVAVLIMCGVYVTYGFDMGSGSVLNFEVTQKVRTIESMIDYYYYQDEDIDMDAMADGIYSGMVDSLGDVYSQYYTAEEYRSLMESTEGIYYGIGASVTLDEERSLPKLVQIYSDTPAQEAGLLPDDVIVEVDGASVYGMSTSEAVELIKGEEGTWVNLTVYREGESDYLSIDVQRRQVSIPTVEYEMYDDGMAYIQITEFDEVTVDQFADVMEQARKNKMKGLILDLRGNPGGSLSSVVDIAQMILPEGLIVYTEDKYGNRREYNCDGNEEIDVPMVVLIDGNSASASEILAGAIKDYGVGTLVGTTTYGKGIVQSVMPLSDGSALKITVSSYYTPSGNNIHGMGIEPDVECVFDYDSYYESDGEKDNQLEKALEMLSEMIGE